MNIHFVISIDWRAATTTTKTDTSSLSSSSCRIVFTKTTSTTTENTVRVSRVAALYSMLFYSPCAIVIYSFRSSIDAPRHRQRHISLREHCFDSTIVQMSEKFCEITFWTLEISTKTTSTTKKIFIHVQNRPNIEWWVCHFSSFFLLKQFLFHFI